MNTSFSPLFSAALLSEADTRMAQALDNFFQRSRTIIQEALLHAIAQQITPAMLAIGQTCLDWLNAYPDKLSTAFAEQFRQHLSGSVPAASQRAGLPVELQLVDDVVLGRQLAVEKAATALRQTLHAEMPPLFSRLQTLRRNVQLRQNQMDAYDPLFVMRALSEALDTLEVPPPSGTFLIQYATAAMGETLSHTYSALYQYLREQGVAAPDTPRALVAARAPTAPPPPQSSLGEDILAHIQTAATQIQTGSDYVPNAGACATPGGEPSAAGTGGEAMQAGGASSGGRRGFAESIPSDVTPPFPALLPSFIDSLAQWQTLLPALTDMQSGTPTLVLRQMQQHASKTDAGGFDLAMLDAVAGLFEFILDDPDILPRYKFAIAQLQIPTLRIALVAPDFFSDDQHPARQLIDLLGQFSRRFPENHPEHAEALDQVEAACASILHDSDHQADTFIRALDALQRWLDEENARAEARLASEITHLEHVERQELGTLLALENLQDLTARHPAPEPVLRQLETAWVPFMASLYVAEAGEGAHWREACQTLQQLFLSMQPPEDDETRAARLQAIPQTNAALRHGLLTQGADPTQLKIFFGAITATQESWIRPQLSRNVIRISSFVPSSVAHQDIESLTQQLEPLTPDDPLMKAVQSLQEGDWVDFDPPYEGLSTARVAWVGVQGYLLFCDSDSDQRFSLDSERLAIELRIGRARIPEQSLTRKAMLRLKMQFMEQAA